MNDASLITIVGGLIDVLGILAITVGIVISLIDFSLSYLREGTIVAPYKILRQNLGRTIIIGLELLIAGDIIRSIAVPPSFTTVGVLGIIVLVRAFLSLQIEKGTEWLVPWSHKKEKA